MKTTIRLLLVTALLLTACVPAIDDTGDTMTNRHAIMETSMGTIKIELFEDKAPITTKNFIDLAEAGFYDGVAFHRVIPDFMIQGGDPISKNYSDPRIGTGGPAHRIPDEFGVGLKHNVPGILSMANSGPNTGGSQFFVTVAATPWLDGKHAIFGKVVEGMDVVNAIVSVQRDGRDKPLTAVVIESVTIE